MTYIQINHKIAAFFNLHEEPIPDYCRDLNAIYDAEKMLLDRDDSNVYWPLYIEFLDKDGYADAVHIPAIFKAESLMQVINLIERDNKENQ